MGPRFKVSFERQLVIVRLTSPGIEPTTSSFQVERSNHRAKRAGVISGQNFTLGSFEDKGLRPTAQSDLNPFTRRQEIIALSKLKAFADDNFNVAKIV